MRLKKSICFILSLFIITLLIACGKKENSLIYTRKSEIKEILTFGSDNQYVLLNTDRAGGVLFSSKYLLTSNYSYNDDKPFDNDLSVNYYKLEMINLDEGGFPKNEVDLRKLVQEYDKNFIPKDLLSTYFYQGKEYLAVYLTGKNKEEKTVLYDLEVGEIIDFPSDLDENSSQPDFKLTSLLSTNMNDLQNKESIAIYDGYISLSASADKPQPKHFLKKYTISQEYPWLVDYVDKMKFKKIYVRPGKATGESYYQDLRRWFAPIGQEPLDIYPEKDENRKLTTYEEYMNWYKERKEESSVKQNN